MKKLTVFLSLVLFASTSYGAKKSWDFDLKGKVQSEYRQFMFVDLNRQSTTAATSDTLTAVQLGGRFDATFSVPNIKLKSRFDVNTDAFGTTKSNFGNGLSGAQKTDSQTYGPSNTSHPRDLFGATNTGPWGLTTGRDGDSNFMFRTLHLNFKTKFASFDVGRMTRHWGLGMFMHDGAGKFDRFSNVTDSFLMHKGLGKMHKWLKGMVLTAGYTQLSNGNNLDDANDDVRLYEGRLEKKRKGTSYGALIAHQRRSDTNFRSTFYDIYLKKKFGSFKLAIEGLFNHGLIGAQAIDHVRRGVSIETSFDVNAKTKVYFNIGNASGSNEQDTSRFRTFGFNRNYNPARTYLMFEQGLGQVPVGAIGSGARVGANLDSNTIFNANYLATGFKWKANKNNKIKIGVAAAAAEKALRNGDGKLYGIEANLTHVAKFYRGLDMTTFGAAFFPGDVYENNGTGSDRHPTDPAIGFGTALTHTF